MSKYVGFRLGKVHESHVISEYYCGGCGWPVTDHDSFCPECGGAFRECDASNLEAENAKLREQVDAAHVSRLLTENENEKLREFAKEACEAARDFYNLGGTFNDLDDLICEAHELGVEVDG